MKNTVSLAALALVGATAANAATLTNGSFETFGTLTGAIHAGSGTLTGWTVESGSVDVIGSGLWAPSDGAHSLDLAGDSPGTISQNIGGLITGRDYTLSFDLAANTYPFDTVIKEVAVTVGGATTNFTFDRTGHSPASMGWTTQAVVFTASGADTLLRFTAGLSGASGPALDNVRVELNAVPIPGAALMLGTALAGLGVARRRKRV